MKIKAITCSLPVAALLVFPVITQAQTIALWTFQNHLGQITSVPQRATSAILTPAIGSGTAQGVPASPLTQGTAVPESGTLSLFVGMASLGA